MENCCESLVKYFMVFFNILFIVAGGVLIGFGAWSQIDAKVSDDLEYCRSFSLEIRIT